MLISFFRVVFLCATLLVLASCSATPVVKVDFGEPFERLVGLEFLGKTKAQITSILGDDYQLTSSLYGGKPVEILRYTFANSSVEPDAYSRRPIRSQTLIFTENKLYSLYASSSFESDSTYFDIDKAATVKVGMNKSEVEAILGAPSGYTITKASLDENAVELDIVYIYSYKVVMLESIKSNHVTIKFMVTELGKLMKVTSINVKSDGVVEL